MSSSKPTVDSTRLTKAWHSYKYHPVQATAYHCKDRFVGLAAGRGSGKTDMAKRKLVLALPERKEWITPRYFYGAPTEAQAKRIAWDHFLRLIPKSWVASVCGLKITTIFGSELYVVGLDKPMRIEGDQWDGCVMDESCDLKPGIFERNILPALAWRNGWCWRIGVPKRAGPSAAEFRKFMEGALAGKIDNASAYTWPSSSILTPEQLLPHKKMLDAVDYAEQLDGIWQSLGGGIYHTFDKDLNVRPVKYLSEKAVIVASDFNVNPMAWVMGHRYQNRMEWFDEIFIHNTNTRKTLDVLYQRYQDHEGGFVFVGDATSQHRETSADQSDYDQILNDKRFKRLGRKVSYPKSNPRIGDKFAATNALLQNADTDVRCYIDPSCVNLIADLESRYYKPGTKRPADDTEDAGHLSDALGYAIYRFFKIRVKLEVESQPVVVVNAA